MRKGTHQSKEAKQKVREANKGRHYSPKTEFKKGQIGWSKGKHLVHSGSFRKGHKSYSGTEKTRFKKGLIPWSKGLTKETDKRIKRISDSKRGKKLSEEHKIKLRLALKGKPKLWCRGEKNSQWKGGITPENKRIRNSIEYRLWRESVFARDNWTDQKTKIKGGKLHPHHIYNFSDYPDLRFAIDNGITFSEKTHKDFHRIYGNKNNQDQINQFLNGNT
jgi:hypothetical protein